LTRHLFQIVLRAEPHWVEPMLRLRALLRRALRIHALRCVGVLQLNSDEVNMKISEEFPGRFLKAADIPGQITVTIAGAAKEAVGRDRVPKLVLDLAGMQQRFIVNPTNRARLVAALGDDTAAWIQRKIELVVEQLPFGRDIVAGIVVRVPPQKAAGKVKPVATPGPASDPDDEPDSSI
jgi:hypothetical protein